MKAIVANNTVLNLKITEKDAVLRGIFYFRNKVYPTEHSTIVLHKFDAVQEFPASPRVAVCFSFKNNSPFGLSFSFSKGTVDRLNGASPKYTRSDASTGLLNVVSQQVHRLCREISTLGACNVLEDRNAGRDVCRVSPLAQEFSTLHQKLGQIVLVSGGQLFGKLVQLFTLGLDLLCGEQASPSNRQECDRSGSNEAALVDDVEPLAELTERGRQPCLDRQRNDAYKHEDKDAGRCEKPVFVLAQNLAKFFDVHLLPPRLAVLRNAVRLQSILRAA